MGGRGKANGGAKGAALVTDQKGGINDLNQIIKQAGFKNLKDAQNAADYKRYLDNQFKQAGVDTQGGDGKKIFVKLMNNEMTAEELKSLLEKNSKLAAAVVAHHIAHYSGSHRHGTLGPIMLRFGLPRDKLLDMVNALKPLHDHSLIDLNGPFTLPGWQDPFQAAQAAQAGHVPASQMPLMLDWLSQQKVRSYVSDVWLKRVTALSPHFLNML